MDKDIREAADTIAMYDKALAEAFINNPFRRVTYAEAFDNAMAEGSHGKTLSGLVLKIAKLDKKKREIMNNIAEGAS